MRVITGSARGVVLRTPDGMHTRPTTERVKESLFSAIQFDIEDRRVLDLFGGSGQLGIEALSRGAASAVFVDSDKTAAGIIRENLKKTNLSAKASVYQTDSLNYLRRCGCQFDLIFLDPPYKDSLLEDALHKICEFDILASDGIMVTERPKGKPLELDFPGYSRSRDYGFGVSLVTIFRKER